MININLGVTSMVVIPLTGATSSDFDFLGSGKVELTKVIGGNVYSFESDISIDRCSGRAFVDLANMPKKVKEGLYTAKIYIKETNKMFSSLTNIRNEYSKRSNK